MIWRTTEKTELVWRPVTGLELFQCRVLWVSGTVSGQKLWLVFLRRSFFGVVTGSALVSPFRSPQ